MMPIKQTRIGLHIKHWICHPKQHPVYIQPHITLPTQMHSNSFQKVLNGVSGLHIHSIAPDDQGASKKGIHCQRETMI